MTTTTAPVRSSGRAAYGTATAAYRRMTKRRMLLIAGLAVALLCTVAFDIARGPAKLSPIEVVKGIVAPDSLNPRSHVIIWDIRMPVALMAVLVGASLSVAGAEMQTILNNPLASPFTLGISAAAGFGIVFWTMGSLSRTTWGKVGVAALVLAVTLPYFFTRSWKLTALRLGEETTHSLGINTQRLRLHILIAVPVLASVSVAFVGTVGFVGLVGPHVARMKERGMTTVITLADAGDAARFRRRTRLHTRRCRRRPPDQRNRFAAAARGAEL